MQLSVVIASADAPANAFVVWRGFEESIRKAAACGYDGVELALGGACDVDTAQLNRALSESGMRVSCISTGLVYAREGLYMTNPDADARERAINVFTGLIRLAADWGGLVNIGRARGFVGQNQTRAQAEELFLGCMERLLGEAQKCDVSLIIEPINRYESNFLNSVDETALLLRRLNSRNVGIMADLFHMNIEDTDIALALTENIDMVRYIHMADSNRKAPGMGHTPFLPIVRALLSAGYNGWLSAEILPGEDADHMALAAARYLRAVINAAQCERGKTYER